MTTEEVHIKIKNNINKLDSFDYDNIESWQINSAFNIAQLSWVRRNLHGTNYYREGDESSKMRINDFQVLLTQKTLPVVKHDDYYETHPLPDDFLLYKRMDIKASKGCCEKARMTVYLAEHANLHQLLNDEFRKPSFEWRETFCTMDSNKIKIWTLNEFDIDEAVLMYYKMPPPIQLNGVFDINTQQIATQTVHPIFKDDIVEIIINEACKILAGNIELVNQLQIQSSNVEQNN